MLAGEVMETAEMQEARIRFMAPVVPQTATVLLHPADH